MDYSGVRPRFVALFISQKKARQEISGALGLRLQAHYAFASAFAARFGAARSLRRVPPAWSYCDESGPK